MRTPDRCNRVLGMLFSGRFVRAILSGQKLTTWRSSKTCLADAGDLVWVRETYTRTPAGYVYRADEGEPGSDGGQVLTVRRWHPSIHCPRKAARIWLRVLERSEARRSLATVEDAHAAGFPSLEAFRVYPLPDACAVLRFERCEPPPVRQLSLPFPI